ncbi:hypothetical protein ALC53_04913 [Atta colombica]|uniref:Uncharacterized protein n=1 Tax=Atta colombica TaxID=520822 RepID=A0A195BKI8_9HYME|nr:hypothetical protein ALC53_04913 [Atta colombica]
MVEVSVDPAGSGAESREIGRNSVARLPLAFPGAWRPGRRIVSGKGQPWAECRMPRVEIRAKTGVRNRGREGDGWKGPQPYIGGLSYRTFTLQSCVVIYGCRSLIRRIRTPLSPHVCCPSIDPIYRDETGVCKVSLGQTLRNSCRSGLIGFLLLLERG